MKSIEHIILSLWLLLPCHGYTTDSISSYLKPFDLLSKPSMDIFIVDHKNEQMSAFAAFKSSMHVR